MFFDTKRGAFDIEIEQKIHSQIQKVPGKTGKSDQTKMEGLDR